MYQIVLRIFIDKLKTNYKRALSERARYRERQRESMREMIKVTVIKAKVC